MLLLVVIGVIAVALIFDYINGFHDAANSIATVVSTRVLSPQRAVLWAAFFNFIAAFTFGTAVARLVGMDPAKAVRADLDALKAIMEKNPHCIHAKIFGPAQLKINPGRIKGFSLPHLKLVNRAGGVRACARHRGRCGGWSGSAGGC